MGKVGIAHWCSQKNTKGKKLGCYSLRQVGVGLPYHSAHHLLTDGLVVKPNMLREQKSRDHWRGSDVAVSLEMVSFFLIHFQLLSIPVFTLSQGRWNDVVGC